MRCTCTYDHRGNLRLSWHDIKPPTPSTFDLAISYNKIDIDANNDTQEFWRRISLTVEDHELTIPPTSGSVNHAHDHATSVGTSNTAGQTQSKRTKFARFFSSEDTPQRNSSDGQGLTQCSFSRSCFTRVFLTSCLASSSASLCPRSPPSITTPQSPPQISALCKALCEDVECAGWLPHPTSPTPQRVQVAWLNTLKHPTSTFTLESILLQQSDRRLPHHMALSRKQRFGIAAALAWAVLHLCESPWIERQLDKNKINIMLEGDDIAKKSFISTKPCLSCKFCRLPSSGPLPGANGGAGAEFHASQIRNLSLFSLGIILIELSLNRPFDLLKQENWHVQGDPDATPTVIEDFVVADKLIDQVYLDAGDLYGSAVQRCIRFEFPGRDVTKSFQFQKFRADFFTGVVAPIQATYEMIPGSFAAV